MCIRILSSWVLGVSKNRALGNLFQTLITLIVKKHFLISNLLQLGPQILVLLLYNSEGCDFVFPINAFEATEDTSWIPPSLLFNHMLCFRSLIVMVSLHWIHYSRCILTNAKKRKIRASVDLLATLLLIPASVLLVSFATTAHFPHVHLTVHQNVQSCFLARQCTTCTVSLSYCTPGTGLHQVSVHSTFNMLRSFWLAALASMISTALPSLLPSV